MRSDPTRTVRSGTAPTTPTGGLDATRDLTVIKHIDEDLAEEAELGKAFRRFLLPSREPTLIVHTPTNGSQSPASFLCFLLPACEAAAQLT